MQNSSSTCYSFDGTAKRRTYTPCNQASPHSMCCHNFKDNSWSPDICLPNGLCYNSDNLNPEYLGKRGFWVESCSDPTWSDPACKEMKGFITSCYSVCPCSTIPKLTHMLTALKSEANAPVTYCPDTGEYCCGRSKEVADCCSDAYDKNTVFSTSIPYARVVDVTTTIAGSVVTTSIPTMISSATAAASTNPSKLSAGAGVGIGIGVALGTAPVLLSGFLLWRRSRRAKCASLNDVRGIEDENKPPYGSSHELTPTTVHELGVASERHELPSKPPHSR